MSKKGAAHKSEQQRELDAAFFARANHRIEHGL
jgi:hypothetical protein